MLFDDLYKEPEWEQLKIPEKIKTDLKEKDEIITISKNNITLGIGSSDPETNAAIAMLNWWLATKPLEAEIEQARDQLIAIKLQKKE